MNTDSTGRSAAEPAGCMPPGPRGYPIVGMLPSLLRDPLGLAQSLIGQYGGIASLNLGVQTIYVVGHPDYAQHILRDSAANFGKNGGMWPAIELLFGKGLATTDGDIWLKQRRMMQPIFQRQKLASLTSLMIAAIAEELDRLGRETQAGTPINVGREMETITIRVFLKSLFGANMASCDLESVGSAIGSALAHTVLRMGLYFIPAWLPIPGTRAFQRDVRTIDQIVFRIIDEHRKKAASEGDLLDLLLQARDAETGAGMDDKQIRDEAVTLFIAGYDTTSPALGWALYLLWKNPAVAEKVRAEVAEVLGNRLPDLESLGRLSYTKMVFQEVLRLYPTVWIMNRISAAESEIGGYKIPARSTVVVLPHMIHRNTQFWDNPEEFRPERFAAENTAGRHSCAYMPFGAGAHKCIGNHFALLEGTLVLAMLTQRYQVKLRPGQNFEAKGAGALQFRHRILADLLPAGPSQG